MKILLIEDDKYISDNIVEFLTSKIFTVDHESDWEQWCHIAKIRKYDLIILDIALPNKDGIQICKEIRKINTKVPIIMLTARDSMDDKILWLDIWADDYIVKPFHFAELFARINSLIRRSHYDNDDLHYISVWDLVLDISNKKVSRWSKNIFLTKKQFQILEYLVRNKNKVVSKKEILQNILGTNEDRRSDVIRSHIQLLREKIDYPFDKQLIQTVRGMWFILSEEKREES